MRERVSSSALSGDEQQTEEVFYERCRVVALEQAPVLTAAEQERVYRAAVQAFGPMLEKLDADLGTAWPALAGEVSQRALEVKAAEMDVDGAAAAAERVREQVATATGAKISS